VARAAGADVVTAARRGYGAACLAGIAAASDADIIVFLDGDNSDEPSDMADLVDPILRDEADFVIGSRAIGDVEPGALTPQQVFGNWLATLLIRLIWGARFTDLGPFRAIRRTALDQLAMADQTYGWTVEMQVKAVEHGLRSLEVPVRYKQRIGVSKVSGTLKGSVLAGYKILSIIGTHALRKWRAPTMVGRGRAAGEGHVPASIAPKIVRVGRSN
ncbi:MAG: glycosyltransferase, partial [Pseudomonadota bacterium]